MLYGDYQSESFQVSETAQCVRMSKEGKTHQLKLSRKLDCSTAKGPALGQTEKRTVAPDR